MPPLEDRRTGALAAFLAAESARILRDPDRDHLPRTFLHLGEDAAFRSRHPCLCSVYRALRGTGLLGALRWLPPLLVTPMQVTLTPATDPWDTLSV